MDSGEIHMVCDEERDWYFTWGYGHQYPNSYIKIYGTRMSARSEMIRRYGQKWAFQYPSKEAAGVDKYNLKEIK
jgi:hypothetical protein